MTLFGERVFPTRGKISADAEDVGGSVGRAELELGKFVSPRRGKFVPHLAAMGLVGSSWNCDVVGRRFASARERMLVTSRLGLSEIKMEPLGDGRVLDRDLGGVAMPT